ncbi:MAG: hypothetical protein R6U44_10085 [Archaeoglobaceae archaeon]
MKRAIALFIVLVMMVSATTPVLSANDIESKPIPVEKENKLPKNVKLVKIDQSIKNATPFWIILAAAKDGRGATFKYIESSAELTGDEKKELKSFMIELWNKYPIKFEKEDRITLIKFKKSVGKNVNLTDKENAKLGKVANTVSEYFEKSNGGVGILWEPSTHRSITYISCNKWGVGKPYNETARDSADDPDFWTQVPPPSGYPDWLWNVIMDVMHSWTHYYNPDWAGTGVETGSAPSECEYYADIAKNNYDSGNRNTAYTNLGYSSHFLTDVGQPLHTGAEWGQYLNPDIHFAYEDYISDNWDSGYNFKSVVDDNWYYYSISDPEQSTKNLGSYSHQYVDTVFDIIYDNPDTWRSNSNLKTITENCLLETAKYTLGLVKYVRG